MKRGESDVNQPQGKRIWTAVLIAPAFAMAASAAELPPASMERPLQDPFVPKAVRDKAVSPVVPSRDAALREQVESKLKAAFDTADNARSGAISLEQARAAGLGYIVRHFDAIDVRKAGQVRFEDVKQFMRARGAQLN